MSEKPKQPATQRYHHGDLKSALLAEARAMLGERGPEELSLRELARRSGVSPRAPYRHFASREDLLACLAVEGFLDLTSQFTGSSCSSPLERVQQMGVAYVRFSREHPALFRLMFGPTIGHPTVSPVASDAFDQLATASRAFLPSNASVLEAMRFATAIWSGLHGISTLGMDQTFGLAHTEAFVTPEAIVQALCQGWTFDGNPVPASTH